MSGFFVSDDGEVTAQGFGLEANVDLSSAKALLLYSAEIRRTKLEPETGVDVTAGFKKTGAALSEPFVDGLFAVSSGLGGAVGNDVSFGLARLNENLLTSCSEVGFGDRTGGLLSVLPSVNRNIRLCSGGGVTDSVHRLQAWTIAAVCKVLCGIKSCKAATSGTSNDKQKTIPLNRRENYIPLTH